MISFYSECTVNCNSNLFSAQCRLMSMVVPELAWETATTFQHSIPLFSCQVVSNSFVTRWTLAHWAPLSVGFPGHEYWSGLPFPAPGDLPNPGIKSCISHIGRQILYLCTTWEVHETVNVCCLSCSVGGTVLQEFKRIHRTGISGIHIPSVVCSTSDLASKSWAW